MIKSPLLNIKARLFDKYKSDLIAEEASVIVINHREAVKRGSVFGSWTKEQSTNLAIHLERLGQAYDEIGHDGRASVFERAALSIYQAIEYENRDVLSLEGCKCLHGIGNKIRLEMIHYWQCAVEKTKYTPREEALIEEGSDTIAKKSKSPSW